MIVAVAVYLLIGLVMVGITRALVPRFIESGEITEEQARRRRWWVWLALITWPVDLALAVGTVVGKRLAQTE